jgi:DNA-binding MarR family transcriptional regulator
MSENDYLVELGALALASRLRRLLQRLHADGERIYRTLDLDFKPKWFPVLHLLSERSSLAVTEIARLMCVAHPSMIQTVDELISAGLVKSRRSDQDGRLRELSLTAKGQRLCEQLAPVWAAFGDAGEEVVKEQGNDFLRAVSILERSLERQSLFDRITTKLKIQELKKTGKIGKSELR